uniref:Uncharacterized protein n=1 Tax=Timema shepardi TaxID=629360 RepID=A0A7R9B245_TIMSH|nr:unnamed protein product [Timema shepardi]
MHMFLERTRVKLEELKKNNHLHVEQSGLEQRAAVLRSALAVGVVFNIAPHLRHTESDYKTGPVHSGLGRRHLVFNIAPHLRHIESDYETGPVYSGLGDWQPECVSSVSTLGLHFSENSVDEDAPPSKRGFQ